VTKLLIEVDYARNPIAAPEPSLA